MAVFSSLGPRVTIWPMGNTALVLVGFLVIVAGMLWLTLRGAGQWRHKLDDLLLPIGFVRCDGDADKAALAPRLGILNPRHTGRRLLLHLYRRDASDGRSRLYVCDYSFASGGGRTSGGQWLVVALVAPGLSLAPMSISAIPRVPALLGRLASALDARLDIPGMRRVQTGQDALDSRFFVHLADPVGDTAWLPPILALLDRAGTEPSLDAGGDTLALGSVAMMADRVRQVLDGQKLQTQLHLAQRLFDALQLRDTPCVDADRQNPPKAG